MINRRRLLAASAAPSSRPPIIGRGADAQAYPNRFVRLIVPLAPGGPTDVAARVMAEPLSKLWGQQVVIENRPGGGTNIAAELVAKSAPDGHTILYATSSLAVAPSLYRTLGYDPVTDFAPVAHLFSFPYYMFVPNTSPAKTVKEFIAHVKANPGKITMASPGTGSAPHLAVELFKKMAGLEMTHVPYRGAGAGAQRSHSGARRRLYRQRLAARERAGRPDPRARRHRPQAGSRGARRAADRGQRCRATR